MIGCRLEQLPYVNIETATWMKRTALALLADHSTLDWLETLQTSRLGYYVLELAHQKPPKNPDTASC